MVDTITTWKKNRQDPFQEFPVAAASAHRAGQATRDSRRRGRF
jgi:hypothetical protein